MENVEIFLRSSAHQAFAGEHLVENLWKKEGVSPQSIYTYQTNSTAKGQLSTGNPQTFPQK